MEQLSLFPVAPLAVGKYVYAGVRGGQIKIGVTTDPTRRAAQLRMTLMRVEPGDERTERALHQRFRASRIDREWFMPTADVIAWAIGDAA